MLQTFVAVRSGFGLEVERLLEQTLHTNALPNKIVLGGYLGNGRLKFPFRSLRKKYWMIEMETCVWWDLLSYKPLDAAVVDPAGDQKSCSSTTNSAGSVDLEWVEHQIDELNCFGFHGSCVGAVYAYGDLLGQQCAVQSKPWHVVQSILFRNPGFVLRHCPVPSDTRAAGSTGDGVCKEMMADLLLWALDHSPSERNYIVIISDVQDRIFASVLYQMHLKGYRIFQTTPQAAKFGLLHRVLAEWPGSFFTIIPDRLQLPLKVLHQHEQHENQANLENFGTGIGPAPVQPLKRFASDCDLRGAGVDLDHKKRKMTFATGVQLADQMGQNSNPKAIRLAKLQTDCRSLLGEIFADQPAGKGYDQAALKDDFKKRFGYELDNQAAGYKSLGMFLDVTMPELERKKLSRKGANLLFLPGAS